MQTSHEIRVQFLNLSSKRSVTQKKRSTPCYTNLEKCAVSTALTSVTGPNLKALRGLPVSDTQKCLHKSRRAIQGREGPGCTGRAHSWAGKTGCVRQTHCSYPELLLCPLCSWFGYLVGGQWVECVTDLSSWIMHPLPGFITVEENGMERNLPASKNHLASSIFQTLIPSLWNEPLKSSLLAPAGEGRNKVLQTPMVERSSKCSKQDL